jgi:hypothetical protein
MKIRILHIWVPAVIFYVLAIFMAFFQEAIMAAVFTIVYMSLLVCAKWARD